MEIKIYGLWGNLVDFILDKQSRNLEFNSNPAEILFLLGNIFDSLWLRLRKM